MAEKNQVRKTAYPHRTRHKKQIQLTRGHSRRSTRKNPERLRKKRGDGGSLELPHRITASYKKKSPIIFGHRKGKLANPTKL